MKRKLLALTLALSMVSMTACGTAAQTPAGEETTAESVAETTTEETTEPATEETTESTAEATDAEAMNGSVTDILNIVYANADLDPELRDALPRYEMTEITSDLAPNVFGTADVEFSEAVYSAPMMSSIAYQCVILRVAEGADVEAVKQTIADNADPRKWVCVEAESTVVENVGDVILFIMADEATTTAVKDAFLALGN